METNDQRRIDAINKLRAVYGIDKTAEIIRAAENLIQYGKYGHSGKVLAEDLAALRPKAKFSEVFKSRIRQPK